MYLHIYIFVSVYINICTYILNSPQTVTCSKIDAIYNVPINVSHMYSPVNCEIHGKYWKSTFNTTPPQLTYAIKSTENKTR